MIKFNDSIQVVRHGNAQPTPSKQVIEDVLLPNQVTDPSPTGYSVSQIGSPNENGLLQRSWLRHTHCTANRLDW